MNTKKIKKFVSKLLRKILKLIKKHKMPVMIVSGLFLFVLVLLLVIGIVSSVRKTIADRNREVLEPDLTVYTYSSMIFEEIQLPDNTIHYTDDIQIVGEYVDGQLIEVIQLGDIGIFGETLSVDNLDSTWEIDQDRMDTAFSGSNSNDIPDAGTDTDVTPDNTPVTPDPGTVTTPDTPTDVPPTDVTPTDVPTTDTPSENVAQPSNRPAVTEYVSAANSVQGLGYIVYAPANANENTPIFLFMHGVGENGAGYDRFVGTFAFLKYLINGQWQPDFIVVAPIMVSGSSWVKQAGNINALLGEVITNYGGNWNCLYAGGFSAGADAITPLAKSINFQGAIYMAGYLGGSGNTTDVASFLSLWSGKRVFYFRDSFYSGGGYGYRADYVASVRDNAESYNVDFLRIDMDYGHVSSMVDAVFLPSYFMDSKANYCHDAIADLIY